MIQHTVMFRFDGTAQERAAAADKFRQALLELPAVIPQLRSIEVGVNINPAEDYDLVLVACADSMADVAAYSAHPAHVAAVALVKPVIKARACVDSEK